MPGLQGVDEPRQFFPLLAVIVDVCARHGTWFDKDELRPSSSSSAPAA